MDHIVFQALTKKAADRYRTMEELREDLAAIAEGLKPLKAKPRPVAIKLAVLPFSNLTGDPEQEYLSDGLTQEMITLLGRLHPESLGVIARTSETFHPPSDIGNFYVAAGEKDKAFEWLEKGLEPHDPFMPYIGVTPYFDALHPDPCFQALLRRMNLAVDEKR